MDRVNLAAALTPLETLSAIVGARPATANDGVAVTSWLKAFGNGGMLPVNATWFITSDGADCTIDSPAGGAGGAELWAYKANKAGVKKWRIFGYLMGGDQIPIVDAAGGAMGPLVLVVGIERIAIAGTPSGGRSPTYHFEPVEVQS